LNRHVLSFFTLAVFLLLATGSTDTKNAPSAEPNTPDPSSRSAAEDVRATAAALFTSRYARSNLASWNIRARPAGADCGVLLVTIGATMDDSIIESLHYSSDVYEGGVEHFYHERTFRGVVYSDASGHRWRYGLVSASEAENASPC
jgi:hypothetical protein